MSCFETETHLSQGTGVSYSLHVSKGSNNTDSSNNGKKIALLCIHGAGYSGRTWGPLVDLLTAKLGGTGVCLVCPDLRGHGDTSAPDELDLSIETLIGDIESLYSEYLLNAGYDKVVLIGWSMGAAVAIKSALREPISSHIVGLIAIDVVEGTAMESLKCMSGILAQRPKGFVSEEEAIEWAISSGTARRRESARVSIPGMLKKVDGVVLDDDDAGVNEDGGGKPPTYPRSMDSIQEDNSSCCSLNARGSGKRESSSKVLHYVWRTPLALSEKYWEGWFSGLSTAFLDVPCPELLLLAGHDRLDTTLMIAQMQGKFQMKVVPHSGHAVHEDQPEAVCESIITFLKRYQLV